MVNCFYNKIFALKKKKAVWEEWWLWVHDWKHFSRKQEEGLKAVSIDKSIEEFGGNKKKIWWW